jgi:hypothetical protein
MKQLIMIFVVVCAFTCGCKTKHKVEKDSTPANVVQKGATIGKVSHQYRADGCATVVIVKQTDNPDIITLIPKDTLAAAFDVDGLEIYFDYRPLKMPNPVGCSVGYPAELKNISKK